MRDPKIDKWPSNLVMIDLDGTLTEPVDSLTKVGRIKDLKAVTKFLEECKSYDLEVKIFTAREDLVLVRDWLLTTPICQYIDGITNVKETALIYIDDRAYRFNGDWKYEQTQMWANIHYHLDLN